MAKLVIAQRNRAVGSGLLVTDWFVVEGCCTRIKLMSFDLSVSLDIILADRGCFGATKNWALEGHDPCIRPVNFLMYS